MVGAHICRFGVAGGGGFPGREFRADPCAGPTDGPAAAAGAGEYVRAGVGLGRGWMRLGVGWRVMGRGRRWGQRRPRWLRVLCAWWRSAG